MEGGFLSELARRDQFIDIMRGVAVLLVVHFHFTTRLPLETLGSGTPAYISNQVGKIGVFIFFIISGYLIAKSMDTSTSLAQFYAKRLSRIWPLFIVSSLTIYLFMKVISVPVVMDGPKRFYDETPTLLDLVGSCLFLRDFGFRWMDGAYWSILVELKFYAIIGGFAAAFKSNYIYVFCNVSIAIGLVDCAIFIFGKEELPNILGAVPSKLLNQFLHGILISNYIPFFALGLALYRGIFDGRIVSLILLCVLTSIIIISGDGDFILADNTKTLFAAAFIILIDYMFMRGRIMLWIGSYSYSIYLFHQVIGLTILVYLVPLVGIDLAIPLTMMVIALLAWTASNMFEWRWRRQAAAILTTSFGRLGLSRITVSYRLGENKACPAEH